MTARFITRIMRCMIIEKEIDNSGNSGRNSGRNSARKDLGVIVMRIEIAA